MIGTDWQKKVLAGRRERRDMEKAGWERVGEGGGKLWELNRGGRIGQRIVDVKIALDGTSLWVRVAKR